MSIEKQAVETISLTLTAYIDGLVAELANDERISLPSFRNKLRSYNLCRENLVYSLEFLKEIVEEHNKLKG